MIHPLPATEIDHIDFVPQAIFDFPVAKLARKFGDLHEGRDDLDYFQAFYFCIDKNSISTSKGKIPIAFKSYRGFPKNTSSLYISQTIRDVNIISAIISQVISDLKIDINALKWQRSQGLPPINADEHS